MDLVDRLAEHRTLAPVPRAQLEWLARHGELRGLEVDEILTPRTGPVAGLYIVLSGLLSITVARAAGPRKVMEWHAGDVTGMMPYSRIKSPPGDVIAEQPSEILALDRALLPEMIHDCHELTEVLVHVMVDRARTFNAADLTDEKMLSLGRLAAGLAHELNNPASAVARSASTLAEKLAVFDDSARAFCTLGLSTEQCDIVARLRSETLQPGATTTYSPLELADREDRLAEWCERRGAAACDSGPLAESSVTLADLEMLASRLDESQIAPVVRFLSDDYVLRRLAFEIETAATRIHSLVAAVRGFTYMDQTAAPRPVDVAQGLSDTLTVMRSKARGKSASLELDVEADLPTIDGFGGELNQVWANLVGNAIDAVADEGRVRVTAGRQGRELVVQVIDNGPGIPEAIQGRIFDPFFTTKAVGDGTGLGLDIARRIVERHHGSVTFTTGSNGTTFRVALPLDKAARARLE